MMRESEDAEQLRMDYDSLCERHAALARVLQRRDDLREAVRLQVAALRETRRKLKECEWDCASLLKQAVRPAAPVTRPETPDGRESDR
jgi:hypothetical protein